MGIVIRNSTFKIKNSAYIARSGVVESIPAAPGVGTIFRIVNTGGTTDSLSYVNITSNITSSGNIESAQIKYILAISGSIKDNFVTGSVNSLTITDLLITASVNENPIFTEQLITTTGAGTWTKPAGVTQVIVECWGGGGAGGGATGNPAVGGGGGGGQYSRKYLQYSSPSIGIAYSVGTGGTGGTGVGGNGGDTTWNTNIVIAKGGNAAEANQDPTLGALGGAGNSVGSVGDVVYFGGTGGFGSQDRAGTPLGGIGAGGAGSTQTPFGIPSPGIELGGSGGSGVTAPGSGVAGSIYGGGGSGAAANTNTNQTGGSGAQGLIRIIYR